MSKRPKYGPDMGYPLSRPLKKRRAGNVSPRPPSPLSQSGPMPSILSATPSLSLSLTTRASAKGIEARPARRGRCGRQGYKSTGQHRHLHTVPLCGIFAPARLAGLRRRQILSSGQNCHMKTFTNLSYLNLSTFQLSKQDSFWTPASGGDKSGPKSHDWASPHPI